MYRKPPLKERIFFHTNCQKRKAQWFRGCEWVNSNLFPMLARGLNWYRLFREQLMIIKQVGKKKYIYIYPPPDSNVYM